MSKSDIRKADDAKKPSGVKSTQEVRAKNDAPTWKATFSKRLPNCFGEPLSSGGNSDTIQY